MAAGNETWRSGEVPLGEWKQGDTETFSLNSAPPDSSASMTSGGQISPDGGPQPVCSGSPSV